MTVHVLHGGLPLCRFTNKVPRDWPEGHRWMGLVGAREQPEKVTCLPCSADLRMIEHGERKSEEPKGHHTGRCGKCGSSDLWEDNTTYGCNACGAIFVC